MLRVGIVDLCIRTVVFVFSLAAFFSGADLDAMWRQAPFSGAFSPVYPVWFLMMLGMAAQMVKNGKTVAAGGRGPVRGPRAAYSGGRLEKEVRRMNRGARKTLLLWLFLSVVVAALYICGVIGGGGVILIVMAYYFCDSLCMLFWCPLQALFMKSRCCANCRIYGWGYFFDFGLLLLLPGVFTYSLAALSLLLLVRWERAYAAYPERFWAGSNLALRCDNCTEKSCSLKRKLAFQLKKRAQS
jgi:hypothetical protein